LGNFKREEEMNSLLRAKEEQIKKKELELQERSRFFLLCDILLVRNSEKEYLS
jgi:hypothetical protein